MEDQGIAQFIEGPTTGGNFSQLVSYARGQPLLILLVALAVLAIYYYVAVYGKDKDQGKYRTYRAVLAERYANA